MPDLAKGELRPFDQILDEWVDLVQDDATDLGCYDVVRGCRNILEKGTSAHRQLAQLNISQGLGKQPEDGLLDIVDGLVDSTAAGIH